MFYLFTIEAVYTRVNMPYTKTPLDVSIYLAYLHQEGGVPLKDLVKRFPQYRKTSIHRHSKKVVGEPKVDRRHNN